MDEVTQQNSALVEENAATAKTLEEQQAAMNERVAYFQVDAQNTEPEEEIEAEPAVQSAPVRMATPARVRPRTRGNLALASEPAGDFQEF